MGRGRSGLQRRGINTTQGGDEFHGGGMWTVLIILLEQMLCQLLPKKRTHIFAYNLNAVSKKMNLLIYT